MAPTPYPSGPLHRAATLLLLAVMLWSTGLTGLIDVAGSTLAQTGPDANNDEVDGLVAPVQVIVDAFPVLVQEAIHEAEYDGNPQRAEALLAQMRTHVANFSRTHTWPQGSTADTLPYPQALAFATEVVELAGLVPEMAARVEIIRASCAWYETASGDAARSWLQNVRSASLNHSVLLLGLQQAIQDLPIPIDPTPLERGGALLDAWGTTSVVQALECAEEAALHFDVFEVDDQLVFFIRPTSIWPTGHIQIFGGIGRDTPAHTVTLRAPGLGLDQETDLSAGGAFQVRHQVPLQTELGDHTITAQAAGHQQERTLQVIRAPVTLQLDHPQRVQVGQSVSMNVRLLDPLEVPPPTTMVHVTGDRTGEIAIHDGTGRTQWTAGDEPGILQGTIRFDGDDLRERAETTYRISVVEQPPGATDDEDPEAQSDGGFWGPVLGRNGGSDGLSQETLRLIAAALAVFALLVIAAMLIRRWTRTRRRGSQRTENPEAAIPGLTQAAAAHFVVLIAALHAWCVRVGVLAPGATVRDMTRRLGANPPLKRATAEFERVRYGEGREDPKKSRNALRAGMIAWRRSITRLLGKRTV